MTVVDEARGWYTYDNGDQVVGTQYTYEDGTILFYDDFGNKLYDSREEEKIQTLSAIKDGVIIGTAIVGVGLIVIFTPVDELLAGAALIARSISGLITRNAGKTATGEIAKKAIGSNLDEIVVTATGVLVGTVTAFKAAESTAATIVDPLIIDLDGDGIETTALADGIYFDMDENGFAETTAWAGTDDGMLVKDINQNGVIDDGSELIATFAQLATYDTNSDGKIDLNDTDFENIKVLKGDGSVMTMDEAGIKSISLTYSTVNTTDENGNQQISSGAFTWDDDSTGTIGGFNLLTDPTDSIETEWLEERRLKKAA